MALELNTAGVTVGYAIESTAGTRPTASYTKIPNIKSIPNLNPEPSSIEVTDLSDTEWKRYIPGLKDPGGSLAFMANNTNAFQDAWNDLVEAAETAKASPEGAKATWFEIKIPGLSKAFYFAGMPAPLGLSGIEVDSVLEIEGYISPNQIAGWQTVSST